MEHRALLAGLVRLHILHHAAATGIYGQWIIEELGRHGYRLSAGTLYPLLHGLEKKGYLKSRPAQAGRSVRRVYRATPLGRAALAEARGRVRELFREILEEPSGRRRLRPKR